jgi:hypothetical protein
MTGFHNTTALYNPTNVLLVNESDNVSIVFVPNNYSIHSTIASHSKCPKLKLAASSPNSNYSFPPIIIDGCKIFLNWTGDNYVPNNSDIITFSGTMNGY